MNISEAKSEEDVQDALKGKNIKDGHSVKGPEPLGCFNSGFRPVLHHFVPIVPDKPDLWVVGYELTIEEAILAHIRGECKRVYGDGKNRVWLYKTRASANKKFSELVWERVQERRQEQQKVQKAHEDLQEDPSDGDAFNTLSNYV